jgi:hypothetical protein
MFLPSSLDNQLRRVHVPVPETPDDLGPFVARSLMNAALRPLADGARQYEHWRQPKGFGKFCGSSAH